MNLKKYSIKKDSHTDMLSSLKKLNKKLLKEALDKNGCETVKELAEYLIKCNKNILDECHGDIFTNMFFIRLIENEGGPIMVPHEIDIRTFVVFLYEKETYLTYYIPDEIKKQIDEFLMNA